MVIGIKLIKMTNIKEEFVLSEKLRLHPSNDAIIILDAEYVKEFIKQIKWDLRGLVFPDASDERRMNEIINKRAGEKLCQ